MKELAGKWMYNTADEIWSCPDEEFATKEEAVKAGREYFLENEEDRESFEVGQISEVEISIYGSHIIDMITEQAYEQCGQVCDSWLDKVNKDEDNSLSQMMTETLMRWLKQTNNVPTFYTFKNVEEIKIGSSDYEL